MREKKVLIADFDEESLISLSNLVYEEGFQAVTAVDGLSAYEKFRADDFDLVILEPMLPKLHGFELCKKINQDPVKKAPIVVVTGIYREPSCKLEALQVYGASAFFTKPWDKDELRSKILQLLVDVKEVPAKKKEAPSAPAPSPAEKLKEAVTPKPMMRQAKMSKGIEDIEKELQQAVSGLVSPSRLRETREKKETRDLNREIDAMLKGAIGGLGVDEKKKRPEPMKHDLRLTPEPRTFKAEPSAKPMPAPRPEPIPRVEPWAEKREKIPIAKEIKENMPFSNQKAGNNIPLSATRIFDQERAPFDIDKTLIEIDKIPLNVDKAPHEPEKPQPKPEAVRPEKRTWVDEEVEPRKRKTAFLVIGAVVAVVFIGSSATFYALKSKKAHQPTKQMVSSLTPSLPTEFSLRQNEIVPSGGAEENESKPEPKRSQSKPAEQPATDAVDLPPALPTEIPAAQLQENPAIKSEASIQTAESATAPQNKEPESQPQSRPEEASVQPPPQEQPVIEKAQPGSLVALNKVDVQPVLIRRVEPKYPGMAFKLRIQGTVSVNALISENGDVIRTEVLKGIKGSPEMERAAEAAIKQWKFKPGQKDGVNVKVWRPIDLTFRISQSPEKE